MHATLHTHLLRRPACALWRLHMYALTTTVRHVRQKEKLLQRGRRQSCELASGCE